MCRRYLSILIALVPLTAARAGPFVADGNVHDGEALTCDLPASEHLRNSVGRDGLGLCVFTSIDHAARWSNEPALIGFRDFMEKYPGGGWPEKVDEYIPRLAASKKLPAPDYVQHTGGDAEFLKLALKTGRYVCVTYNGRDGVFYRGTIAHMVNLVHFSEKWAVIHDNNYPGKWLWMPPADFLARWRGTGGGWAIVLLKPGPPPVPVNLAKSFDHRVTENTEKTEDHSVVMPDESNGNDTGSSANLWWKPDAEHPGWFYLYRGAVQVGTWHPDGRGYKELRVDGTWSEPCDPPIPLPAGSALNFGIEPWRVPDEPRYRINGQEVSRAEALAAVGNLADDSARLRLTIVGDDAMRQRVLAELAAHAGLNALRDRLLVQDYPPDHWAVTGVGFAPGITLQPAAGPDGKAPVLFRMREYSGPDALQGAIRKADPNYQPERDPDPTRSPATPAAPTANPSISIDWTKVPPAYWALGGMILFLLAFRRKEKR
jgi:hypothetical protein